MQDDRSRPDRSALLDGPLALDNNAIDLPPPPSSTSRRLPAGRVLVVLPPEAGNMLAKSLSFLAGADAPASCSAHASIADQPGHSLLTRLASTAVASRDAAARQHQVRRLGACHAWMRRVINAVVEHQSSRCTTRTRTGAAVPRPDRGIGRGT